MHPGDHTYLKMASGKELTEDSLYKLCLAGTAKNPELFDKWYGYVSRELTSNASKNVDGSGDFNVSVEQLLSKDNKQEELAKFQELKRRLYDSGVVDKKDELLRFFAVTSFYRKMSQRKKEKDQKDNVGSMQQESDANEFKYVSGDVAFLKQSFHSPSRVSQSKSSQAKNYRHSFSPSPKESNHSHVNRRGSTSDSLLNYSSRSGVNKAQEGKYTQHDIIKEIIYAFNGIGGNIFKDDCGDGSFRISQMVEGSLRQHAAHLAEIGTLNYNVRKIIDSLPQVGSPYCLSALVGAIRDQLLEFTRLVSDLEADLLSTKTQPISLLQRTITHRPKHHLKWLTTVAHECKDKKGGALLSVLHSLSQHGDPKVKEWILPLLSAASAPFYAILSEWLERGTVKDPFGEFFISIDKNATVNNFWHQKFFIREQMRPSFITWSQANMILATGKSVAFLRQCCGKSVKDNKVPGLQEAVQNCDKLWNIDGALQVCIEAAHKEFSKQALTVMLDDGKLSLHLQAMRRYMLLGSGDFIKLFMEYASEELDKQAGNLMAHSLTPKLESAIRATNAQYEDEDVLNRLDVKLLSACTDETGWDIFSLHYNYSGPIAMIFPYDVRFKYLSLFNALWRAKRIERLLSKMWRSQVISARELRKMTEIRPLCRELSVLISEMNQFMQQMQYYQLFECVECQWCLLQNAINQAASMDDIIHAHNKFLDNLMRSCFLDEESKHLLLILRQIYNHVLGVSILEDEFDKLINNEFERRRKLEKLAEQRETESTYSYGAHEEEKDRQAQKKFRNAILTIKVKLYLHADGYRDQVKEFLLSLASHPNEDLQFLSLRLDFNEYYKMLDKRLSTPHTLSYRRRSSLMPPFAGMTVSAAF